MTITYGATGFRLALLGAIGQYLQAEGVAKWTTPWAATDTAISVDVLPSSPDKAIALTLYEVSNGPGADSIMGLQCRVRGKANNRTEDKNLVDALFDALDGVESTSWGGIPIVRVWNTSGTYLGADSANRNEYTYNFYIQLTRTGKHRQD